MTATPYPLQWPPSRPQRGAEQRKNGPFSKQVTRVGAGDHWTERGELTVEEAFERLESELQAIGAQYCVVSSNLEVRLNGYPRSNQRKLSEPGVAVYFQLKGEPRCLPCDTYNEVAQNIAAVAAHIKATRAIERHGVASVAEMFAGFTAIAAQPGQRAWWAVLGLERSASVEDIEAAFRRLARERHPDHGGSTALMAELNTARDAARKERS
jgi:hypothetical protein